MDTRRWARASALVFEPYTKEAHAETFEWIARHGIFAEGGMGDRSYEDSVISLPVGSAALAHDTDRAR
jgi:hypothetical protein